MLERQPQPHRGAVIENVNGEPLQRERGDEGLDRGGQVSEGVFILAVHRDGGETVAGEVRGDDPVGAREQRDQVAELVGGGGEAVEEEDGRRGGGPAER